jgi:hypothetical protein
MKLILRLAQPKDSKERMFRIESDVDDIRNPGEAFLILDGKEYVVELHYDRI